LDAIDGKQARRTNSSTPLGELFDHGCDAVSTVFVVIATCVCLRLGESPWIMFFICFSSMAAFYIAHWQTYCTGVLQFGKCDVTEAQLIIYSMHLMTGLFGDALWALEVPIISLPFRYLPGIFSMFGTYLVIFSKLNTISYGGVGKNGASVADTSIVFPVFPLFLILFLAFVIGNKSANNIFEENICLYILEFGFVWAKVTTKLIVAHMTKGEIFLTDSCLIGPVILLLNQYFGYLLPEFYVLSFCLVSF
jgi:phosphatidylglycerophosphate synthase